MANDSPFANLTLKQALTKVLDECARVESLVSPSTSPFAPTSDVTVPTSKAIADYLDTNFVNRLTNNVVNGVNKFKQHLWLSSEFTDSDKPGDNIPMNKAYLQLNQSGFISRTHWGGAQSNYWSNYTLQFSGGLGLIQIRQPVGGGFSIYDGSSWNAIVTKTSKTNPQQGDYYYNSSTGLEMYDGTDWVSVSFYNVVPLCPVSGDIVQLKTDWNYTVRSSALGYSHRDDELVILEDIKSYLKHLYSDDSSGRQIIFDDSSADTLVLTIKEADYYGTN